MLGCPAINRLILILSVLQILGDRSPSESGQRGYKIEAKTGPKFLSSARYSHLPRSRKNIVCRQQPQECRNFSAIYPLAIDLVSRTR